MVFFKAADQASQTRWPALLIPPEKNDGNVGFVFHMP